ncbi:TadE/TadG family type IV pilus assembly protein [Devosia sp. 1635]|uniref:TadE/TadG family type IV pilus assembly protein n=1 Tax=Devosia sp. 1635 TaxID=2726066 RepID=UPI001565E9BF|nr:TadE/TadG family type IV pilus assembly protein [Devosia sp. 1635]
MTALGLPLRRLKTFSRDATGASAVEFALVAPLLFAVLFATLEAGWTMLQTIMLDRALDISVRSLRIGSMENPTHGALRDEVCDAAMILVDCNRNLILELIPVLNSESYPSDQARCVNRSSTVQPTVRFNAGQRSQTVFVRACFVVDPLTPLLGLGLALPKDESGAYRIIGKTAFANEPGS